MAHLSFAELLQRHVPLSSGEAVALTLAAAAVAEAQSSASNAVLVPDLEQILLNSTGCVSFAPGSSATQTDEASAIASVLLHLLRVNDEGLRTESGGRIPGGLLIVLARVRGQIDLPVLTAGALREALSRFSSAADSSALAAIFWRAARMRARARERGLLAARVPSARVERRTNGPSNSELRRWLRQAEQEAFDLRRGVPARMVEVARGALHQFKAAAGTVALLLLVVGSVALGMGVLGDRQRREAPVLTSDAVASVLPSERTRAVSFATAPRARDGLFQEPNRSAGPVDRVTKAHPHVARRASLRTSSVKRANPERKARPVTVRMVNLPRASWSQNQ